MWPTNYVTYYFLLQCKYIMIKKLMQLLIGVVDAELFERVDSKVFKTEDVKNTKKARGILAWVGTCVDVIYQPRKGARVQGFRHGVSVLLCLRTKHPSISIV